MNQPLKAVIVEEAPKPAQFFPDPDHQTYESMLTALPVMLHAMDFLGTLTSVNQRWTEALGFSADEVKGRSFNDFLTPDSAAKLARDIYPAYFKTGHARDLAIDALHKNGEVKPFTLSMDAHRGAKGRVKRSLCLMTPVMKDVRREAPDKSAAVAQFKSGLSASFNNLLSIAIGNLEILEGKLGGDPIAKLRIFEAVEAARSATRLAAQMLGTAPNAARETDVHELLAGMTPFITRAIGEAIELKIECAEGMPKALADPAQVELAILNLIGSAREAMPRGGALKISVDADERHIIPMVL